MIKPPYIRTNYLSKEILSELHYTSTDKPKNTVIKTDNEDSHLSIEEKMLKFYKEKEENANKLYNKALYESPPPPTDAEMAMRKNSWRYDRSAKVIWRRKD